jgi:hypothetical protein
MEIRALCSRPVALTGTSPFVFSEVAEPHVTLSCVRSRVPIVTVGEPPSVMGRTRVTIARFPSNT